MRKKISFMALVGLTALVIGGCGQKGNGADGTTPAGAASDGAALNEASSGSDAAETVVYREPPVIELHPVSGEGDSLIVKSCGYTWNWPEGPGMMGSGIADGPAPLDGTHWDTLILPESSGGLLECGYALTIEVEPDELGIEVWDMANLGNSDAQSEQSAVYQGAEIAAEDFSIPLQAGKVYDIYIRLDEGKIDENGCSGIASYVFMTALPVQDDTENDSNGLTATVEGQPEFPEATFGEVYTEEIDSIDGLTMTVTNVTPEGASLEIRNQTGKEITFGDDYELQAWQDESWYRVDYIIGNWAFNMIGYETGPEGAKDSPLRLDVTWTYFHGILPAGRYRITKTAIAQENDTSVKYLLAAEFEVE